MDNNVEQAAVKSKTDSATVNIGAAAGSATGTVGGASGAGVLANANSNSNSTFWKNSGRRVPGRPSPKRELDRSAGLGVGMVSTFRDYQQSVSDAWDTGDDEFCIISNSEAAAAAAAGAGGKNIK